MNAQKELIGHIEQRKVKYVYITLGDEFDIDRKVISGTLEEVLPQLNFHYDDGFGSQELFGCIWYEDGTWSERVEYDGSEWWEYKRCPEIPNE